MKKGNLRGLSAFAENPLQDFFSRRAPSSSVWLNTKASLLSDRQQLCLQSNQKLFRFGFFNRQCLVVRLNIKLEIFKSSTCTQFTMLKVYSSSRSAWKLIRRFTIPVTDADISNWTAVPINLQSLGKFKSICDYTSLIQCIYLFYFSLICWTIQGINAIPKLFHWEAKLLWNMQNMELNPWQ